MLVFAFSLLWFIPINAKVPDYLPVKGLIGWWPFNANANDESGNANHGTVHGSKLAVDRFGADSSAYSFNGVSDYIEMFRTDVPKNIYNGLTISFWFKAPMELDSTARHFILSKYNGMGLQVELFQKSKTVSLGSLRTDLRENGTPKPDVDIYSPQRYDDGNWHLGVLRWNAPYLSQYVDGQLISTLSTSNTYFDAPDATLLFGCLNSYWINPTRYFFKGQLDDIGIWNRSLSDKEISLLFNGSKLIYTQPVNQSANIGQDVIFSVDKIDSLTSYQWQSNASNLGWVNVPENSTYSGVKSNILKIKDVQLSNHFQQFRVIASYESCSDTSKIVKLAISDTCIVSQTVMDTLVVEMNVLGIDNRLNKTIVKVYPNPAKDYIVIDLGAQSLVNGYSIRVSNALGQSIFESEIQQQKLNLDLSKWNGKGIYLFEILNNEKVVIAKKSIILK